MLNAVIISIKFCKNGIAPNQPKFPKPPQQPPNIGIGITGAKLTGAKLIPIPNTELQENAGIEYPYDILNPLPYVLLLIYEVFIFTSALPNKTFPFI